MKIGRLVAIACIALAFIVPSSAWSREAAPVPYRGAPLIPWAKSIGEHRFRSPRNYDRTLDYYNKTVLRSPLVVKEKIINTSAVRAVHLRNKKAGATWEGLNIYEYKGTTTIFVVFSEKELEKIAKEKENKAKKSSKKRKKKSK